MNDAAVFDVLDTVVRLDEAFSGVSHSEVQIVGYLACLMSVYRGRPASTWGYDFIRSGEATPYSPAIDKAFHELYSTSDFDEASDAARPTSRGKELHLQLSELTTYKVRSEFVEAACSAVLVLSTTAIRAAIRQEPCIRSMRLQLHGGGYLLEESQPSSQLLYDQFQAISSIGSVQTPDLLVPSAVWLTYLCELDRKEIDAIYENV